MTAILLAVVFLFQQMQFRMEQRSASSGELPPARKEIKSDQFNLQKVYGVGGEAAEYLMGSQRIIPYLSSSGELYLADSQMNHIKVFDNKGKLVQEIGRQGEGPGEFQSILQMRQFNGHLYVLDFRFRINVFDIKTKKHVKTVNVGGSEGGSPMAMARMGFPMDFYPVEDGFYFVMNRPVMSFDGSKPEVPAEGLMFKKADLNGVILDEPIKSFKSNESAPIEASAGRVMVMSLPFGKRSIFGFDAVKRQLIYAWTGDFEVTRYDLTGKEVGKIKEDLKPSKITSADLAAWQKSSGQGDLPKNTKLPEYKPLISAMVVDDLGRVWIEKERGSNADRAWLVYDASGKKLGELNFSWDYRFVGANDKHILLEHTSQDEFKSIEVFTYKL